jgi:iron complex outermembrane receptor protein
MKKYCCMLFCLVLSAWAVAQAYQSNPIDSNKLVLPNKNLMSIDIYANKLDAFKTGVKTLQIDTLFIQTQQANSMADVLSKYSQMFIKSYGAGGLATAGFRGSSANQTAILWNGFNLQSPMLGQADFALLPASLFENVSIDYGSTSSIYGSGAVGGSVILNNGALFQSGLRSQLIYSLGSFNNQQQVLKLSYGDKKSFSSIKLFNQWGDNDYTFLNQGKEQKQSNAKLQQSGLLWDEYLQVNSHNQVSLHLWVQGSDRQIPPAINTPNTKANQQDESLRLSAEWKYMRKLYQLNLRSALLKESITFSNTNLSKSSANSSQYNTFIENYFHPFQNHYIQLSANYSYTEALSDAYSTSKQQNRLALFASYKIVSNKYKLNTCLSSRKEFINGQDAPLVSSLGFEFAGLKNFKLSYNINQSYRLPTFNELYWNDATAKGDINLKSEQGWGEEFTTKYTLPKDKFKNIQSEITSSVYNRFMDDFIQWTISNGYSSPLNISQTKSMGLELQADISYTMKGSRIFMKALYDASQSTIEKSYLHGYASLGKQIAYSPRLKYSLTLGANIKSYYVLYNHTYTGIRFTTSDNNEWLDSYSIGNFSVGQNIKINKIIFNCNLNINNAWNENYQVIANRGVPMRNYQFTLSIKI